MLTKTEFEEILNLAPEWSNFVDRLNGDDGKDASVVQLFEEIGAKSIYSKICSLKEEKERFLTLVRDHYYRPLFEKMLNSNQNLKRFWIQRRVDKNTQQHNCISLSHDLAEKMHGQLEKQLAQGKDDGFKVLLPAYAQRSVYNAVVDYVRREWQWEKDTLQDLNLDPRQVDPRVAVADEIEYSPEQKAISGEQVGQLNSVRTYIQAMLGNAEYPQDALIVVDCMFGLGLTPNSKTGVEMTMRETCETLNLPGETQARKIARCQVLLDKGLDLIRETIRSNMPGVATAWQADVNINNASRRELNHLLGLTEGEVDRLIKNRQYYSMIELVEKKVIKQGSRIEEIQKRGAVAAFIPVDLNMATRRDIIDICGMPKDAAKKIVDGRPYNSFDDLLKAKIINPETMAKVIENGALLKAQSDDRERININKATDEELKSLGLDDNQLARFLRARPFQTWAELEDFLCMEEKDWKNLREKACLSISSS